MKCKKCRKDIPDGSKFCNHCGTPQKNEKMYRRSDGLYEKIITIDGKRVAFRAKTEREVTKKIAEFKGQKERGRYFAEVAEEWKEEHFPTLAYNSTKNYSPAYRRAVEHFGEMHIKQIKPQEISSFIYSFSKKGYAQKTVSTQILVINLIFEYAVLKGDLDLSPSQYIKVPKNLPRSVRLMPSEEDIETVKRNVGKSFGLFAFFVLYTGCRRGEALAIQQKDINRKAGTISITKSVYHDNNKPMLKSPKTRAGIREIPLLDQLAAVLPKGKKDDYLFHNDAGELLTSSQFSKLWGQYCKDVGFSITPHQLRHGYATILYDAGIQAKDAQRLLGHTSIAMTMDVYTEITSRRQEMIAQKLNKYTKSTQYHV